MAYTYYIDGYNVIHHSALLKPLAAQDFEVARSTLIEKVARFCVANCVEAKIVFDGRGRRAEPLKPISEIPGLEVVYSPGHQTADTVIERIVYTSTNRRSIIVVSGDRGIRSLCQNLSALVMDPDNFLASCRESDANVRSTLQVIQRPDDLRRIENRLDDRNLDRLRKLRSDLEP